MRAKKGFVLFISNEDLNDIIKIIKSRERSRILIDSVTKTVKHEIKKPESEFIGALLAPFAASVVQRVISSVVEGITAKGVMRSG